MTASLDIEQQRALAAMQAGRNTFVTGGGGVGKSHLIRQFVGQRNVSRIDLTAPTGVAAINLNVGGIQGRTINRWAGILLGPQAGQAFEDYWEFLKAKTGRNFLAGQERIRRAECLVIDEVSMLTGRLFSFLDWTCRRIRQNDRPFGGIQIIAVGDFLQLPPVRRGDSEPYDWVFKCEAWRQAEFVISHLTTPHRQSETPFIDALNAFRFGQIRGGAARLLMGRVARFPDKNLTRLFTHNAMVDKWNNYQLAEIESEERTFTATLAGSEYDQEFLRKNLVTPEVLSLKRGARVMFTANKAQGDETVFANGEIGTVEDMAEEIISVRKDTGSLVMLEPNTWSADPQNELSGTFTQFPLRLAYAMTIHKAQGITIDSALIDIRAAREPGQAYVAASRVRSLSGLHLKDYPKGIFVSPDAIEFYRNIK
ncbi:MAG: AAA family ATPase [Opitutaceae bacterium]|jgi:ATP-dependent exoDNAse (exonuclease V) alpha subunit|nr:AAA family ATPase [Opitutaceae bacterium]